MYVVYAYICVVCVFVCTCTHTERPDNDIDCLPLSYFTLIMFLDLIVIFVNFILWVDVYVYESEFINPSAVSTEARGIRFGASVRPL